MVETEEREEKYREEKNREIKKERVLWYSFQKKREIVFVKRFTNKFSFTNRAAFQAKDKKN